MASIRSCYIFLIPILFFWAQAQVVESFTCSYSSCDCKTLSFFDEFTLLQFKFAIFGDPHGILDTWKQGGTACNSTGWLGVCCNFIGDVTEIYLPQLFISGRIPSIVGSLASLVNLDLSNNNFYDLIPSTIGQLSNLVSLNLGSNQLSGSLPASLASLQYLKNLDLNTNLLSGPIPSNLNQMTSIQNIVLSYNALSGSIPATLGNIPTLEALVLFSNHLKGSIPSQLGQLTNLITLYLDTNQLTGTIPTTLGKLSQLQSLTLDNNLLSGSIPASIGSIPFLSTFTATGNFLEGSVPSTFSSLCKTLSSTGTLDLSSNCLATFPSPCPKNETQKSKLTCGNFYAGIIISNPGVTFSVQQKTNHQSSLFRHASAGFLKNTANPAWEVATSYNWADQLKNWAINDQGQCYSCWAITAVTAIEAAAAITFGVITPPVLSVQQIVDCEGTGGCTLGGWPQNGLEYASQNPVMLDKNYPYAGVKGKCHAKATSGDYKISHYEVVDFYGWVGLLLAVQQQPVIVDVEATSSVFLNYRGGILSDSSCFSKGVDHSVLLVGYDLTSSPPVWVIRNSWGRQWGENGGYMRLAIQGGDGVCGINTLPGYYPVIKNPSDPCNSNSYGLTTFFLSVAPGIVNPCGEFTCVPNGASYSCLCKQPFVSVKNIDGQPTCVPANPCSYFSTNPCGVGNCVDMQTGNYTCLCPLGYLSGYTSFSGSPTCVPGSSSTAQQFYTVPAGTSITCNLVMQTYGIPQPQFLAQNTKLSCAKPIPAGSKVNVTVKIGCELPYIVGKNDTCKSIQALFGLGSKPIGGVNSPNPSLSCSSLNPGQQICIVRGVAPDVPLCTLPYLPRTKDSCASIIKASFKGNALAFFQINPGLNCDRLFSSFGGTAVSKVCLAASTLGSIRKGCYLGKFAAVLPGQSCEHIGFKYFHSNLGLYKKANGNHACDSKKLFVGMTFCTSYK